MLAFELGRELADDSQYALSVKVEDITSDTEQQSIEKATERAGRCFGIGCNRIRPGVNTGYLACIGSSHGLDGCRFA